MKAKRHFLLALLASSKFEARLRTCVHVTSGVKRLGFQTSKATTNEEK